MTAVLPPRFTLDKSSRALILCFGREAHSLGIYPPPTSAGVIKLWESIFQCGVEAGIKQAAAPLPGFYERDGANIVHHREGAPPTCIATADSLRVAVLIARLLNDFAAKYPAEEREHVA